MARLGKSNQVRWKDNNCNKNDLAWSVGWVSKDVGRCSLTSRCCGWVSIDFEFWDQAYDEVLVGMLIITLL